MSSVVRDGDIVKFPTDEFMREVLLQGFAFRKVGKSVAQQGDPIP